MPPVLTASLAQAHLSQAEFRQAKRHPRVQTLWEFAGQLTFPPIRDDILVYKFTTNNFSISTCETYCLYRVAYMAARQQLLYRPICLTQQTCQTTRRMHALH